MTPRERFLAVMNGQPCGGRLPMVEWAPWWDKTVDRWEQEGLPANMDYPQSLQYFGLDELHVLGLGPAVPPVPVHGAPVIENEAEYDSLKKEVLSEAIIDKLIDDAKKLKARHDAGEISIRVWLDGFFWFPRTLFGIEPHLYAFYDNSGLMRRMNNDLERFNLSALEALFPVLKPEFVGIAEDMSYNHGPMLSRQMFDEFIAPHYLKLTAYIRENKVKTLVDSDGDVSLMIPWLIDSGIDGIYPLERQAGVDISRLQKEYPGFIFLGAYDKMVMDKGEDAMRAEFERLLPAMRAGRFIPSVDHQTPPGVCLDNYRIYLRLFREYAEKAVN